MARPHFTAVGGVVRYVKIESANLCNHSTRVEMRFTAEDLMYMTTRDLYHLFDTNNLCLAMLTKLIKQHSSIKDAIATSTDPCILSLTPLNKLKANARRCRRDRRVYLTELLRRHD